MVGGPGAVGRLRDAVGVKIADPGALPRLASAWLGVAIGVVPAPATPTDADPPGAGELIAPAKSVGDMHRIIVNDYVNSTLTAGFLFVVVTMVVYGVLACRKAYANNRPTVREYPESHQLTAADEAADAARA